MNVVSLDHARSRRRARRRIEPPSVLALPARPARPAHADDSGEDRLRMRQNELFSDFICEAVREESPAGTALQEPLSEAP